MMCKTRRETWASFSPSSPYKEPGLFVFDTFLFAQIGVKCHDLGARALPPKACPICYVMVPETLTEVLTPLSQATRTLANIHQFSRENEILSQHIFTYKNKTFSYWEFPGGPVVRTLCFHC